MHTRARLIAGIGAATTVLALAQPVASASAVTPVVPRQPMRCYSSSAPHWSFSGKRLVYKAARNGRVYGQSGVTLSIQKGTNFTIGGSVTGTTGLEAGVLFAKASASLSVSVTASRTTSTTFSGSWKVPRSQSTGWLEVGTTKAYKFNWKKWHMVGECTVHVDHTGTATAPTRSAALMFRHS